MAVSPDNTGAGNGCGHRNPTCLAPSRITANGPDPPAENRTSNVDATGDTEPSAFRLSVVSTPTHEPSARRTRCGRRLASVTNEPSGRANVKLYSSRSVSTSTRRFEDAARANAADSSTNTGTPSSEGSRGAAHARSGATSNDANTIATAPAATNRNRETRPRPAQTPIERPAVTVPPRITPSKVTVTLRHDLRGCQCPQREFPSGPRKLAAQIYISGKRFPNHAVERQTTTRKPQTTHINRHPHSLPGPCAHAAVPTAQAGTSTARLPHRDSTAIHARSRSPPTRRKPVP
ncbi:hypothetical protein Prum_012470 [Phytohabitans rumicis]|uniref:Uncharacterized protein n=1 Tax=Phytohabitans rumicis TaxID=1076125 RepID=A0A6V8L4M7_9ACTN|nr:hypothetical protein Prum_012470 [Phytohabitans rumicis]